MKKLFYFIISIILSLLLVGGNFYITMQRNLKQLASEELAHMNITTLKMYSDEVSIYDEVGTYFHGNTLEEHLIKQCHLNWTLIKMFNQKEGVKNDIYFSGIRDIDHQLIRHVNDTCDFILEVQKQHPKVHINTESSPTVNQNDEVPKERDNE